jgi:3D (Asp-Asp-Asp) domain-containing protein
VSSYFGGTRLINSNLTGIGKQPYCVSSHTLNISILGPSTFDVTATYTGGDGSCVSYTESMAFGQTCNTASGTFQNQGDGGGADIWTRVGGPSVNIQPDNPVIPTTSRVQNKKVLTHSDLTLSVTNGGQPVSGASITLQSDRSNQDQITQPKTPTDASGVTTANVETRDETSKSTITSATMDISTGTPGIITWLPADYESDFLVTCYVVSSEADYLATPLIGPVNGLPAGKKYHSGFIADVKLQGSGIASDATTIHYDGSGVYSVQNCPLTATGACAADGTTIAVDRNVIPLRSTVSIDTVGTRAAQDTGGAISGYHIDVYFGTRRQQCVSAGRQTLSTTFEHY